MGGDVHKIRRWGWGGATGGQEEERISGVLDRGVLRLKGERGEHWGGGCEAVWRL